MAEKKNDKSGGAVKTMIIIILVFIIVPILVLGGFYYASPSFQMQANQMLSQVPGPVGSYFDSFPTEQEISQQLKEIAEYMLSIDSKRAVDKMILLDNEDRATYDEVVKHMLRMNPNATRLILEEIRNQTVQKDIVATTLEQIQVEQSEEIMKKADYLKSLSLPTAVEEMQFMMAESVNGHKNLAAVLSVMTPEEAAKLMKLLPTEDFNKIMTHMETSVAQAIRTSIADMRNREVELRSIAEIYSTEDISKLVDLIGNTSTYSLEELAKLYLEMGPVKAGQVLAKAGDDNFVFSLVNEIKDQLVIEKGVDDFTGDLLKSLKIYKEFDDKVTEMVDIYGNMGIGQVAAVIEKMIRNSAAPRIYDLESGDTIIITDENVALEILSRFNSKKVGEILATYNETLAAELSRKLMLPNIN